MTNRTWHVLLIPALAFTIFSGCQMGKLSMPKMAFWKKDRGAELDASYIEPPSLSLAPSDSEFESKTATAKNDPAAPPSREPYETSPPTGSSIANAERFSTPRDSLNKQDGNSFVPPNRSLEDRLAQQSVSTFGSSNSLTPKLDPSDRSTYDGSRTPSPLSSSRTTSPMESFQSNNSRIPASTYEMPGGGALQPAMPNNGRTVDNSFQGMNVVSGGAASQASLGGRRIANPYLQSAGVSEAGGVQGDAQATGYQYESTPHPSYEPRSMAATQSGFGSPPPQSSSQLVPSFPERADSSSYQEPPTRGLPESLLQGQGVYAPGSVIAPGPVDPAKMTAPPQTFLPASSGGSFQPN